MALTDEQRDPRGREPERFRDLAIGNSPLRVADLRAETCSTLPMKLRPLRTWSYQVGAVRSTGTAGLRRRLPSRVCWFTLGAGATHRVEQTHSSRPSTPRAADLETRLAVSADAEPGECRICSTPGPRGRLLLAERNLHQ